jgi:exosortase/archaeosortase family protein
MSVFIPPRELRALAAAGAAMLIGTLILQQFPALELSLFAAGAARLTGFLTGMPVGRIAEGWLLTSSSSVIAVTAACSATDYYLMVVALLTWQRVRQGQTAFAALLVGLFAALPLTLFINALRIVGVTAAHRWLGERLPETYDAFLHLFFGVAVFLPALIALNLLLEMYGRTRTLKSTA